MKIWYDITKIWYCFKYGIINLIVWFPIIWANRNWDYYFFYKIIQKKLKLMENLHRFHGHHVGDIDTANQMKICIVLIDKLIKNDYNSTCFDEYYNKWGHSYSIEENNKLKIINEKKIKNKEDKIQKKKDFSDCIKEEERLKLKDKNTLFKIITDNIDSWWD